MIWINYELETLIQNIVRESILMVNQPVVYQLSDSQFV